MSQEGTNEAGSIAKFEEVVQKRAKKGSEEGTKVGYAHVEDSRKCREGSVYANKCKAFKQDAWMDALWG